MVSTTFSTFVVLALAAFSSAAPADIVKQNALDAQKLNAKFATLTKDSPCSSTSCPLHPTPFFFDFTSQEPSADALDL